MKVRVTYTVDVDEDSRQQIRSYYGDDGLANRQEIRDWYRKFGESMDDDLAAGWVGDSSND